MRFKPKIKPYKHQRKGLIKLWQRGNGALLWEPGTGKTKTALDFASALHISGKCDRVLILCPINALQVWSAQSAEYIHSSIAWELYVPEGKVIDKADQIMQALVDLPPSVMNIQVLNYDAVIKRDCDWLIMKALQNFDPDLLILDESQKVKNATAKRSKAAHILGDRARHVIILSGTPISKNYLDLYSQFKCIDPSIWRHPHRSKDMSWTEFRNYYGIWGGRSGWELRGYQNINDLQRRYKPLASAVRKRDCLDLPPTTDTIIPILMSPNPHRAYSIFADEGMVVWQRHLIEAPIILTKLLRLQEMAGGSVHDELGAVIEFHRDKMTILKDLVIGMREAELKFLIFARFKWEMRTIAEEVNTDLVIKGGVSHKRRQEVVRRFIESDKEDALIIQIASGEALDGLQHVCSNAIFYSTDFSWANYSQARGRLERSGQKEPITFHHLHMQGSVDKLVYQALREKRNLEKMILDDPDLLVVDRD